MKEDIEFPNSVGEKARLPLGYLKCLILGQELLSLPGLDVTIVNRILPSGISTHDLKIGDLVLEDCADSEPVFRVLGVNDSSAEIVRTGFRIRFNEVLLAHRKAISDGKVDPNSLDPDESQIILQLTDSNEN